MKLTLKNIGKIRQAEIEIEGVTVIGGENNTGKSTVGKALYALCGAFHDMDNSIQDARINSIVGTLRSNSMTSLSSRQVSSLVREKMNELLQNTSERRAIIDNLIRQVKDHPRKTLLDDQDKGDTSIDEKTFKRIEKIVDLPYGTILAGTVWDAFSAEFGDQVSCLLNQNKAEILLVENGKSIDVQIADNTQQSEGGIDVGTAFFQTGRAIYIDNAVDLFENDTPSNHREALWDAFSAGSKDSNPVDNLIARQNWATIWGKINKICEGDLVQDRYLGWRYRDKNGSFLLLKNVSTGILALAILKRLIANGTLQENGILILDEPETHLHPEWQIAFAEIIILLCREMNFRILINTHSYYFLHAIEVFSRLHKIEGQCRYYLSQSDGDMAKIEDVTGSTDKIYEKLWEPIQKLKDIRAKLGWESEEEEDDTDE